MFDQVKKVSARAITKDLYDSLKILFLLQNSKNSLIHTIIDKNICYHYFFIHKKTKGSSIVFRKSSNSGGLLLRISKNLP